MPNFNEPQGKRDYRYEVSIYKPAHNGYVSVTVRARGERWRRVTAVGEQMLKDAIARTEKYRNLDEADAKEKKG